MTLLIGVQLPTHPLRSHLFHTPSSITVHHNYAGSLYYSTRPVLGQWRCRIKSKYRRLRGVAGLEICLPPNIVIIRLSLIGASITFVFSSTKSRSIWRWCRRQLDRRVSQTCGIDLLRGTMVTLGCSGGSHKVSFMVRTNTHHPVASDKGAQL